MQIQSYFCSAFLLHRNRKTTSITRIPPASTISIKRKAGSHLGSSQISGIDVDAPTGWISQVEINPPNTSDNKIIPKAVSLKILLVSEYPKIVLGHNAYVKIFYYYQLVNFSILRSDKSVTGQKRFLSALNVDN